MKKFVFFADIHKYGCYAIDCELEYHKDSYYLGDNIDLACCAHEDVFRAQEELAEIKEKFGDRYISGNHELEPGNHVKVGNVLLTHGDYVLWPKAQADAYRARKPGIGPLARFLVWLSVGKLLALRDWKISRLGRHRCFKLAKEYGCDTIVIGHWHPLTIKDFTFKGIRIIVLPRGRTELEL